MEIYDSLRLIFPNIHLVLVLILINSALLEGALMVAPQAESEMLREGVLGGVHQVALREGRKRFN